VHDNLKQGMDLIEAVRRAVQRFVGAYALLVFDAQDPTASSSPASRARS